MKQNPAVSLIALLAYIMIIVSFPKGIVISLIFFIIYPAYLLGVKKIDTIKILKQLALSSLFVIAILAGEILYSQEYVVYSGIVTTKGFLNAISLFIRYLLTISTTLIFVNSYTILEIAQGMRSLRIPDKLIYTILIQLRFADLIKEQAISLNMAKALRIKKITKDTSIAYGMLLSLFMKTYIKGNNVTLAWEMREPYRFFDRKTEMNILQLIISIVFICSFILIRFCFLI